MRAATIAVLGDINLDVTLRVPHLPALGDDLPIPGVAWHRGGAGLNTALAFDRLGATVRLIGCVGRDAAAAQVLHLDPSHRLDLRWLQQHPTEPTGVCTVLVTPDGQRTFISARGANLACAPDALAPTVLADCALLFVCAHALLAGPQQATALQTIAWARDAGVPVALDLCLPTIRAAGDLIHALLPQLWLLTLNETELRALRPHQALVTGLDHLKRAGVRTVALKRGGLGCWVVGPRSWLEGAPPTVQVVDTNGCGDAFSAGLAWALLQGLPEAQAIPLANGLGALTATRPGAADALPSLAELQAYLDPELQAYLAFKTRHR